VHGDLRLGNLIVGPAGLQAVIDWELVHLGDPLEDLAWLCVRAWRYGAPRPVAGVGTLEALFGAYEAAGGHPVDPDAFHWWLVQKTLQWGVICMAQAAVHLTGAVRSVELAAIGRRVAEQEWDLLELIAPEAWAAARAEHGPGAALDGDDDRDEPPTPGPHGRPTAGELLESVDELLRGPVMDATEGRVRFHARVAANVVRMVEREVALGPAHDARFREGLASLGASSLAALAEAIRRGDHDEHRSRLETVLAAFARDRLAVSNPDHLRR
jgi:hypothetical protein